MKRILAALLLTCAVVANGKEVQQKKSVAHTAAPSKASSSKSSLLAAKIAEHKSATAHVVSKAIAADKVKPAVSKKQPAAKTAAIEASSMRFRSKSLPGMNFGGVQGIQMPGHNMPGMAPAGMVMPFGPNPAYGSSFGGMQNGLHFLGANPYQVSAGNLYQAGIPGPMGGIPGYNAGLPGSGGSYAGMSMPGVASLSGPTSRLGMPMMLGAGQQAISSYPFMLNFSVMGQQVPLGVGSPLGPGMSMLGHGMFGPGNMAMPMAGAYGSPYMSPASYFPMNSGGMGSSPAMHGMYMGNMMHNGMAPMGPNGMQNINSIGNIGSGMPTGFIEEGPADVPEVAHATEKVVTEIPGASTPLEKLTGQQFMALPSTLDADSSTQSHEQGLFDPSLMTKDPPKLNIFKLNINRL